MSIDSALTQVIGTVDFKIRINRFCETSLADGKYRHFIGDIITFNSTVFNIRIYHRIVSPKMVQDRVLELTGIILADKPPRMFWAGWGNS
jgi:hypothetical protein